MYPLPHRSELAIPNSAVRLPIQLRTRRHGPNLRERATGLRAPQPLPHGIHDRAAHAEGRVRLEGKPMLWLETPRCSNQPDATIGNQIVPLQDSFERTRNALHRPLNHGEAPVYPLANRRRIALSRPTAQWFRD